MSSMRSINCVWQERPDLKKGERSNPSNYRPVSLTCIICKLFEHIIASHIIQHLEDNNILYDLQHGFRRKWSCESQLLSLVHELMHNYENNIRTLQKLSIKFHTNDSFINCNGTVLPGTYIVGLTDRSQKVIIEGVSSSPISVTSGVTQGTVLGPLLFLVYVNSLTTVFYIGQSNLNLMPSFFKKTSIHFSPGPLYGKWNLILTSAAQWMSPLAVYIIFLVLIIYKTHH